MRGAAYSRAAGLVSVQGTREGCFWKRGAPCIRLLRYVVHQLQEREAREGFRAFIFPEFHSIIGTRTIGKGEKRVSRH